MPVKPVVLYKTSLKEIRVTRANVVAIDCIYSQRVIVII